MRTIKFLIVKEFRQIFRNKTLLPLIFFMPVMQLLILPYAADFDVKNINISIVDHDHSSYSRNLITKILSSGYFRMAEYNEVYSKTFKKIESDKSDLILEIPLGFESNLARESRQKLFISINAINGTKALMGNEYLNQIIADYNSDIRLDIAPAQQFSSAASIALDFLYWYNIHLNYKLFMVPGILVMLVTLVCALLCSLNIVREKEVGTLEQINVTPIHKFQFIIGKLVPFWFLGIFMFSLGLTIARLVYGIIPLGNIALLYGFLSIYLIAMLGFGFLISTFAETQQQAVTIVFLFILVFFLMSGLFTPIESMPPWAIYIAQSNPVTYFVDVVRMIVLKGSSLKDIRNHIIIISGFAILFNALAIYNYKKTS
jgi:ABC-2 type transport system permease protein